MASDISKSQSTIKDFDIMTKLGQGSFGVVYKVQRKVDNNTYVLKQINISKMNTKMKNEAVNEVTILSTLECPYIVQYYDSFIDKTNLNIVMEYCEGGDLSGLLKSQFGRPLTEAQIWKIFIQVCLSLDYLHKKKILHRDIQSMNIFLSQDQNVRLGDLGVAQVLQDQVNFANTMVGTPFYLSPEMCQQKPYNQQSDVWALGCVLYEMCTFKHPFEANNQGALILQIIRGKYNPIPTSYSQDLAEVVDMCLCRDYRRRPSVTNILEKSIVLNYASSLKISLASNTIFEKPQYGRQEEPQNPGSVTSLPNSNNQNPNNNNNNNERKPSQPNQQPADAKKKENPFAPMAAAIIATPNIQYNQNDQKPLPSSNAQLQPNQPVPTQQKEDPNQIKINLQNKNVVDLIDDQNAINRLYKDQFKEKETNSKQPSQQNINININSNNNNNPNQAIYSDKNQIENDQQEAADKKDLEKKQEKGNSKQVNLVSGPKIQSAAFSSNTPIIPQTKIAIEKPINNPASNISSSNISNKNNISNYINNNNNISNNNNNKILNANPTTPITNNINNNGSKQNNSSNINSNNNIKKQINLIKNTNPILPANNPFNPKSNFSGLQTSPTSQGQSEDQIKTPIFTKNIIAAPHSQVIRNQSPQAIRSKNGDNKSDNLFFKIVENPVQQALDPAQPNQNGNIFFQPNQNPSSNNKILFGPEINQKSKDDERKDISRIRKGAPTQISRQASKAANLPPPATVITQNQQSEAFSIPEFSQEMRQIKEQQLEYHNLFKKNAQQLEKQKKEIQSKQKNEKTGKTDSDRIEIECEVLNLPDKVKSNKNALQFQPKQKIHNLDQLINKNNAADPSDQKKIVGQQVVDNKFISNQFDSSYESNSGSSEDEAGKKQKLNDTLFEQVQISKDSNNQIKDIKLVQKPSNPRLPTTNQQSSEAESITNASSTTDNKSYSTKPETNQQPQQVNQPPYFQPEVTIPLTENDNYSFMDEFEPNNKKYFENLHKHLSNNEEVFVANNNEGDSQEFKVQQPLNEPNGEDEYYESHQQLDQDEQQQQGVRNYQDNEENDNNFYDEEDYEEQDYEKVAAQNGKRSQAQNYQGESDIPEEEQSKVIDSEYEKFIKNQRQMHQVEDEFENQQIKVDSDTDTEDENQKYNQQEGGIENKKGAQVIDPEEPGEIEEVEEENKNYSNHNEVEEVEEDETGDREEEQGDGYQYSANDDIYEETINIDSQNQQVIIQQQLEDALQREKQLITLISIQQKECVMGLGQSRFDQLVKFFRQKLNADHELTDEDQDQIDEIIHKQISQNKNPNILVTLYKILHLETEHAKTEEKIQKLAQKLDSLSNFEH